MVKVLPEPATEERMRLEVDEVRKETVAACSGVREVEGVGGGCGAGVRKETVAACSGVREVEGVG